jgi:iron complex outermembrane receptor protein
MSGHSYVHRPVRAAVAAALCAVAGATAIIPSTAGAADAASAATADTIDEVTVTGSRIVRRDLEAASPIVTVEAQAFDESSTLGMETVLNQLPQFVPANTQFVAADIQPGPMNTPGISTLNMRGLGSNRTLVLIDGRRGQPANASLVVDINSIPSAAIASVEIISGGASAVYGADAMGGVTNFKLKNDFQGAQLEMRGGITGAGDGEEYRASSLIGVSLGGSGNVMLGLEWMRRESALYDERDFFRQGLFDTTTGGLRSLSRLNHIMYETTASNNVPSQAAVNALFPGLPPGQNAGRTGTFYFNDDRSTIFRTERGGIGFNGPVGAGDYRVVNGQLAQNELGTLLSSPMDRYSIFSTAKFDFNDHVGAFSRAMFVSTEVLNSRMRGAPVYGGFGADIPYGPQIYRPSVDANGNTLPEYRAGGSLGLNCPAVGGCTTSQAFPVPASLASLLDSRGPDVPSTTQFDPATGQPIIERGVGSTWRLGIVPEWLDQRSVLSRTQMYQVLAGLEGRLGLGDWTWEAYVSHGETNTTANYTGQASTNLYAAIVESPNFGRNVTLTGPGGKTLTCTSGLPIFEDFTPSQDCIDAINITSVDRTDLQQDIVEANFQGGLFNVPAGQVRAAAGLSWRRNSFSFIPDFSRDIDNILDVPAGAFGGTQVGGETRVKEVYGELLIPLLRDLPLVRSLELELGGRYSDYNTGSGSVPTYKALFSWSPTDALRIRGGYQLANRAPNVNELFSGVTNVVSAGVDPCLSSGTGAQPWGNVAGNPNRAQVQALCSAIIGSGVSDFDADPNNWVQVGGVAAEIAVQSGNAQLDSEKGETWTLGFVLQSPFQHPALSGMSLAVDWYQANIEDAISTVSNTTTYQLCFNQDGLSNPTYSINDPNGMCSRIERDAGTGNRERTFTPYSNLGVLETSGIDLNLSWRTALADIGLSRIPGFLSLNLSVNYLLSFDEQDFPSQAARDLKGNASNGGLFDYRTVTTVRYSHGDWQAGLTWRYMPGLDHTNVLTNLATTTRGTNSYNVFNLFGGIDVNENLSISGGVDNLFDKDPPIYGASPTVNAWGQTLTNVYDVLGRRYYATVRLRF